MHRFEKDTLDIHLQISQSRMATISEQLAEGFASGEDVGQTYKLIGLKDGWMFNWMKELKDLDIWWRSNAKSDLQSGLSNTFAFRESKIHLLKKIRDKLQRLESSMVCDSVTLFIDSSEKLIETNHCSRFGKCWMRLRSTAFCLSA